MEVRVSGLATGAQERLGACAQVVLGDEQAGVPNSRASSIVSQPPTSRRPRSLTRLPSGNTAERLVPVPSPLIIACRLPIRSVDRAQAVAP